MSGHLPIPTISGSSVLVNLKIMRHDTELPATPMDADSGAAPMVDHPLEVAAKRGFGPLSEYSSDIWHGGGVPCVTCAQLVRRGATMCDACGQDLSPEMIQKMRAHAGPWYVYEHVRPFPGVSLDRIIRQIHRGLITETSIVRGPTTDYQWRFAVETPGLCRYFLRCWQCHDEVGASDLYCAHCLSSLSFDRVPTPAGATTIFRGPDSSSEGAMEVPDASGQIESMPAQIPSGGEVTIARRAASDSSMRPPVGKVPSVPAPWPAARAGGVSVVSPELVRLRQALHASQSTTPPDASRDSQDVPSRDSTRSPLSLAWIAFGASAVVVIAIVWRILRS